MTKGNITIRTNFYQVNFNLIKKTFSKQKYKQSTLFVKAISEQLNLIFQCQLNDDYAFSNFINPSQFYEYVSKNKKKKIISVDNRGYMEVKVESQLGSNSSEVISFFDNSEAIEKIEEPLQKMMKTKMIQKQQKIQITIEKELKKRMQQTIKQKQFEQKAKKISLTPNSQRQIVFTTTLNPQEAFQITDGKYKECYITSFKQLSEKTFVLKLLKMNTERIYISVQHQKGQQTINHNCQFGKSYQNSFRVEEGQSIEIGYQDGELLISNINNKNGKLFDIFLPQQDLAKECKIIISLRKL